MGNPKAPSPREATERCRNALLNELALTKTKHARDQMLVRDLIDADILHLFQYGFVYDEAVPAKKLGFFKYALQGSTPNSFSRKIKVIIIPNFHQWEVKIITVMWADES